jgi:hypothetical protein
MQTHENTRVTKAVQAVAYVKQRASVHGFRSVCLGCRFSEDGYNSAFELLTLKPRYFIEVG